jgi:hypothetical protein
MADCHGNECKYYCLLRYYIVQSGRKLTNVSNVLIAAIIREKKKSSLATRHGGAWGERRYSFYSFSTSALDRVRVQHHTSAALCPGERTPGTHCTGGWVGPRDGLDTEDRGTILCLCRGSNPDRQVVQSAVRHHTD